MVFLSGALTGTGGRGAVVLVDSIQHREGREGGEGRAGRGKIGGFGGGNLCFLRASFGSRRTDGQTDMAGVEKRFFFSAVLSDSRITRTYIHPSIPSTHIYARCRLLSTST